MFPEGKTNKKPKPNKTKKPLISKNNLIISQLEVHLMLKKKKKKKTQTLQNPALGK